MLLVGLLLIILNFFDAVFTAAGLAQGVVTELNPILAAMYSLSPALTFAAKTIFVPLGVLFVVVRGTGKPWAFRGLLICFFVYLWAAGLHFQWIYAVLFS